MKTLQVLFNLRVSVTVSWQKRSRWNCMCHDAGVLAYTLASWHGFRKMAPFSVTTHEFSMKVLRRGRSIHLREMSTIPHFIVNSSLFTVIARNTFTVIARLHRSRGNLHTEMNDCVCLRVLRGVKFVVYLRRDFPIYDYKIHF